MERMIELHASFCFMKFYLHYFVYPPGNRKTFLGMFEKFPWLSNLSEIGALFVKSENVKTHLKCLKMSNTLRRPQYRHAHYRSDWTIFLPILRGACGKLKIVIKHFVKFCPAVCSSQFRADEVRQSTATEAWAQKQQQTVYTDGLTEVGWFCMQGKY